MLWGCSAPCSIHFVPLNPAASPVTPELNQCICACRSRALRGPVPQHVESHLGCLFLATSLWSLCVSTDLPIQKWASVMCPHTGYNPKKTQWFLRIHLTCCTWTEIQARGRVLAPLVSKNSFPSWRCVLSHTGTFCPSPVSRELLRNGQLDSPASLVDTPDWVEGNSLSQPVTDSRLKKLQTGHPQLVMFVMSNLILPRTAGCAAP